MPYTMQPAGVGATCSPSAPPEALKAFGADRARDDRRTCAARPLADAAAALQAYLRRLETCSPTAGRSCSARCRASPTSRPRTRCGSCAARRRSPACSQPYPAVRRLVRPHDRVRPRRIRRRSTSAEAIAVAARRRRHAPRRLPAEPASRSATRSPSPPTDYAPDADRRHARRPRRRRGRRRAHRRARRHACTSTSPASASRSRSRQAPTDRRRTHHEDFKGRTAVITGAGSGFGLETSRIAARAGHEHRAWPTCSRTRSTRAAAEIERARRAGAAVPARRRRRRPRSKRSARPTLARFGAPHFVFNNAGVGAGGLIWENTRRRTGSGCWAST